MSALSAAKTKNHLKGLHPLLSEWTAALHDFCLASGFDNNPWWFNERATLSTLAGAAWRLRRGWSALEEFSTTKRGVVPGKEIEDGKVVRGRCDLYVSHQTTDFAIEAKQSWQSLTRSAKTEKLAEAMRRARRDAGNLTKDEAEYRVGAVFTVPYIAVRDVRLEGAKANGAIDPKRVLERVDVWIRDLNLRQFDAYAYYFTPRCKEFLSGDKKRVFPGVLLTMSHCKKGNYKTRNEK